jgi:hypothetical protein
LSDQKQAEKDLVQGYFATLVLLFIVAILALALPYLIFLAIPLILFGIIGYLTPHRYGKGVLVGVGWTLVYYLIIGLLGALVGANPSLPQKFIWLVLVPCGILHLIASINYTPPRLQKGAVLALFLFSSFKVLTTHQSNNSQLRNVASGNATQNVGRPTSTPTPLTTVKLQAARTPVSGYWTNYAKTIQPKEPPPAPVSRDSIPGDWEVTIMWDAESENPGFSMFGMTFENAIDRAVQVKINGLPARLRGIKTKVLEVSNEKIHLQSTRKKTKNQAEINIFWEGRKVNDSYVGDLIVREGKKITKASFDLSRPKANP